MFIPYHFKPLKDACLYVAVKKGFLLIPNDNQMQHGPKNFIEWERGILLVLSKSHLPRNPTIEFI